MPHTLGTLALPDLIWVDEFQWSPVARVQEYAINGALIVDVGVRQSGRPITLAGDSRGGWMDRTTLLALMALEQQPAGAWNLTLADGRVFAVAFAPAGVVADQLEAVEDPAADTPYVVKIHLHEVAA